MAVGYLRSNSWPTAAVGVNNRETMKTKDPVQTPEGSPHLNGQRKKSRRECHKPEERSGKERERHREIP